MSFAEMNNVYDNLIDLNLDNASKASANVQTRKFKYCSNCNRPTVGHSKPTGDQCTFKMLWEF